jgi:poly(3-hydroxybutyrate) depolymerase
MLASHDHVLRKLLAASCSLVSLLSLPAVGFAEPLPAFNVDIKETSVSGLSSGGFMAVQFEIAFSSIVKGAGIIAGGPYFCARGSQATATGPCMKADGPINVPELVTITNNNAAAGLVDATSNLANHKVWLFSGTLDSTVKQAVMNELNAYYVNFIGGSNIFYKKTIPAAHSMPTEVYGNVCSANGDPYINDCDFDAAGELLKWIYGSLNPRRTGPASEERFVEFDQSEFLPNPTSHGMANTGWLYVPSACAGGQACRLHVAFHGCKQYPSYQYFVLGQGMVTYGTTFVKNSGYNGWADTNNMIVLYPQTTSSFVPFNPLGCWDWWGFDDAAYVTRNGRQMRAVKAMVDHARGRCPRRSDWPARHRQRRQFAVVGMGCGRRRGRICSLPR